MLLSVILKFLRRIKWANTLKDKNTLLLSVVRDLDNSISQLVNPRKLGLASSLHLLKTSTLLFLKQMKIYFGTCRLNWFPTSLHFFPFHFVSIGFILFQLSLYWLLVFSSFSFSFIFHSFSFFFILFIHFTFIFH